ncbi:hypothetical protein [Nocardia asiatica]|uniref:hypothetical protein n=1 Tax=Nocardia asiatica TaxID=209252 RepID=UPI0024571CF4|nr:hypothetical protein [Nocardia asiatica]
MSNVRALDNPNHMFIPRHELTKLRELLLQIPSLAVDLGVAITKQARLGEIGKGRKPRRPSEQPLPYHIDAAAVADELHNELTGWVRVVCEQRAIEYTGPTSTPGLARWLERHIIALAMTEGSETALTEIGRIFDVADRIVCPPALRIVVDAEKLATARRQALNASGIAALAKELGEEFRHLTKRRVFVLREAKLIQPLPGPWRADWPLLFRVGDVLDAHLTLPIRARHAKAS